MYLISGRMRHDKLSLRVLAVSGSGERRRGGIASVPLSSETQRVTDTRCGALGPQVLRKCTVRVRSLVAFCSLPLFICLSPSISSTRQSLIKLVYCHLIREKRETSSVCYVTMYLSLDLWYSPRDVYTSV